MSERRRYKRILVPLDGSGWSQRAIPHAADLARDNNAELILLPVFRPPAWEYAPEIALAGQDAQIQQARDQMHQYLSGLRAELRGENLDVRVQIIEGQGVARLVCEYADSEAIDLIVMSTHGRSGLSRVFFGSIANEIMQRAEVPVLLVRPDKD